MTDILHPPQPPDLPPEPHNHPLSPRWGSVPKLVASLAAVALVGGLISRFREMIGPLILALLFAYLMNPILTWLTRRTKLSWGAAVNLIYLTLFILLVAGLTAAVIGIVQESQGLYQNLVDILPDLPNRLQSIVQTLLTKPFQIGVYTIDLSKPIDIGPFRLDFAASNLTPLLQQVVTAVQPVLSQAGVAIGSLASVTASMFGWLLFLLVISYYLLHDLRHSAPALAHLVPRGYAYDAQRLTDELGPIWNAFFRGQITLAVLTGCVMGVAMLIMGVRYAPVLGLVAAAAEFIPIVGPIVSAIIGTLVALFQPGNPFGLSQPLYALVVVGVYTLYQQVENNFLGPRIVGGSLHLNPAVVIIGAFIASNLAGIVGLILASPLLATLRLFGTYLYRKLFDLDPWPPPSALPPPPPKTQRLHWLRPWLAGVGRRLASLISRKPTANDKG